MFDGILLKIQPLVGLKPHRNIQNIRPFENIHSIGIQCERCLTFMYGDVNTDNPLE
jgi:hypothetical protein